MSANNDNVDDDVGWENSSLENVCVTDILWTVSFLIVYFVRKHIDRTNWSLTQITLLL